MRVVLTVSPFTALRIHRELACTTIACRVVTARLNHGGRIPIRPLNRDATTLNLEVAKSGIAASCAEIRASAPQIVRLLDVANVEDEDDPPQVSDLYSSWGSFSAILINASTTP